MTEAGETNTAIAALWKNMINAFVDKQVLIKDQKFYMKARNHDKLHCDKDNTTD